MPRLFDQTYPFDLLEDAKYEFVHFLNKNRPDKNAAALWSSDMTACFCLGIENRNNIMLYHSITEHAIYEPFEELKKQLMGNTVKNSFLIELYNFLKSCESTESCQFLIAFNPSFSKHIESDIEKFLDCINGCIDYINQERASNPLSLINETQFKIKICSDGYFYLNHRNESGDLQKALRESFTRLSKEFITSSGSSISRNMWLALLKLVKEFANAQVTNKLTNIITGLKKVASDTYLKTNDISPDDSKLLLTIISWDIFSNGPSSQIYQKWCAKMQALPDSDFLSSLQSSAQGCVNENAGINQGP